MKLKDIKCPNCSGRVIDQGKGKYYCDSCGSSFLIDRDEEDVEYERIINERIKLNNQGQEPSNDPEVPGKRALTSEELGKGAAVAGGAATAGLVAFVIISVAIVIVILFAMSTAIKSERRSHESYERAVESMRADSSMPDISDIMDQSGFMLTESVIRSDEDFLNDLYNDSIDLLCSEDALGDSTWEMAGEPEYVTSYFLRPTVNIAAFDDAMTNRLINIYATTWNTGDGEEVVIYSATTLTGLRYESDGAISCSSDLEILGNENGTSDPASYGNEDLHTFADENVYTDASCIVIEMDLAPR